ncbi:hypothetical protein ABIF70_010760 [Bradyrhizobium japonicum]
MVEDAAVVGPGDGAQLDATILDLERLHLLGAMGRQAVLQIDTGQRCRKLPQIGRWRSDQAGKLTEAPMGRRDRRIRAGQHQRQAFGIVAARLDPDRRALDGSGAAPLCPATDGGVEVRQGQVTLVRRPREPFRRYTADPLAAAHIHLVAASAVASGVQNLHMGHG